MRYRRCRAVSLTSDSLVLWRRIPSIASVVSPISRYVGAAINSNSHRIGQRTEQTPPTGHTCLWYDDVRSVRRQALGGLDGGQAAKTDGRISCGTHVHACLPGLASGASLDASSRCTVHSCIDADLGIDHPGSRDTTIGAVVTR
jgi:hypothetical protein